MTAAATTGASLARPRRLQRGRSGRERGSPCIDRPRSADSGAVVYVLSDESGHHAVAGGGGAPAHDDGDDMMAVAPHRGQQIEAGRMGVAGFDAVDAANMAEQMIVIAVRLAAPDEGAGREIAVIARKAILDRAAEHGEIMRRGDLLVIGQAGGVGVMGPAHAELMRLAGHHLARRSPRRRRYSRRSPQRCHWPNW